MARMIPETPKDFHGSKGEERVFRALRMLPDDVTVLHSLRWVHPGNGRTLGERLGGQGEGDFVLVDPARGIMVVEVKGGDVWCEDGEWRQRNRGTEQIRTVFPEEQASQTKFRIRAEIAERCRDASNVLCCHAVWFPDGVVNRKCLPMNCHPHMTLDAEDIAQPEASINRAFAYWRSLFPKATVPGSHAKRILGILAPSLSIVRSVRQTLDEREEQLIQLTRDQARVLDFLDEQKHAAIIGAAGTGKTLLAIEKARRLSSPSAPVLFLCFNAALRDHLRSCHAQPNVSYHSFHGFARDLIGPTGSLDEAVQEVLRLLAEDAPLPYAHLIVDEAQDFEREWLEYLRHRFRDAAFYAFYDRYQAVQGQNDTAWLDDVPCRLVLTKNCRNTDPIARAAYRAAGLPISPTLGLEGPQPTLHAVPDQSAALALVGTLVESACKQHKTPAHDVAVLSMATIAGDGSWAAPRLGGQPTADAPRRDHLTVTTARRFKGLEASLVIIVDVDFERATDPMWRRLLYVACTRARHAVHIVTTTPEAGLMTAVHALVDSAKARPSWRALCRSLGVRLSGGSNDPFD